MYWVLHIVDRDIIGCTNSTCVQLQIPSTCIPFLEVIFVCLSPAGSSIDLSETSEDEKITYAFKSVLLLISC